jgi:extracellular solute-binding protein (family 7)
MGQIAANFAARRRRRRADYGERTCHDPHMHRCNRGRRARACNSRRRAKHGTPKGLAAEKFKELGQKYTDGKAKIEVYANSTLYKDKEEVEALQLGAVQMLAPSVAKFGPLGVREFEVFDLPYILPDKGALRRVTDGDLGKKLLAMLQPKGITGLAMGQRVQDHERQSAAAPAGARQGAGGADARARRHSAGDGVLRCLSGAANRRRRRSASISTSPPPSRMGITELTVAVLPWLVTMLVFLVVVTYWPELTLFLPRVLGML